MESEDGDDSQTKDSESDRFVQAKLDDPAKDPLFPEPTKDKAEGERGIFARKRLLRVGYVPDDEDRIVGRDEEIQAIADEIGVVVNDEPPNNVGIYGKTGTGKSLVARHVTQRARRTADARGVSVATVYLDCSKKNTETKAAKTIARSLNQNHDLGVEIPRRGIGADDYYDYLWEDILSEFDHAIVILDEVDALDEVTTPATEEEAENKEGVLYTLSRAEEQQYTDCNLGIVAISNKARYEGQLSERVDSSFHLVDFVFKPYNAHQLRKILENRRDAFHEGVLEEGVIEKCAALSAQEHGDARKAIVVLKAAGEAAANERSDVVTESHIENASDYAEVDRVEELMEGNTPQAKAVLYALASLQITNDKEVFRTSEIYEWYEKVCEVADLSTLTYNRVYGLLREQKFLEIIASQRTDGGRKNAREHWLLVEPEVAVRAVVGDLGADLATADELKNSSTTNEP